MTDATNVPDRKVIDRGAQPMSDRIHDLTGWSNFAIAERLIECGIAARTVALAAFIAWSPDVTLWASCAAVWACDAGHRVACGRVRAKVERAMMAGRPVVNPWRRLWLTRVGYAGMFVAYLPAACLSPQATAGIYFGACQPRPPRRKRREAPAAGAAA